MVDHAKNLDIFKFIILLILFVALILLLVFWEPSEKVTDQQLVTSSTANESTLPNTSPASEANHPETPAQEQILAVATEVPESLKCPNANQSRISGIGAHVKVINSMIPLRSTPSAMGLNIIRPLPIGTRLEVISQAVCVDYLDGANLWWRVRTDLGDEGYAAEGSAISGLYYLEEIK